MRQRKPSLSHWRRAVMAVSSGKPCAIDGGTLAGSEIDFQLVIKIAKMFGLHVPDNLVAPADEVIERCEGRFKNETFPKKFSPSASGRCRAAGRLAHRLGASLSDPTRNLGGSICRRR